MSLNYSNSNQKPIFSLEILRESQGRATPITCRVCDEIFFDNKRLVNHFLSHLPEHAALLPRIRFKRFVSSVNHTNSLSGFPQFTLHSNNHSDFRSEFASPPTGPRNFHSHVEPPAPDTLTTQSSQLSFFCLHMSSDASSSQRSQRSNFCAPISVGTASRSWTATCSSPPGRMSRSRIRSARLNEVEHPFTGCTKPYILQLEHPIVVDNNNEGGNNPNEMDLTLKL